MNWFDYNNEKDLEEAAKFANKKFAPLENYSFFLTIFLILFKVFFTILNLKMINLIH